MRYRFSSNWRVRCSLLLASVVLVCGALSYAVAGKPGGTAPQSNAFGKPLSEWFALYWSHVYWDDVGVETPDQIGNVKFLPIPDGEYLEGDGTAEDPSVFVGHLDVTWKVGTAFVLPVAGWSGWEYDDGTEDLPLDPSAFYGTVLVDGEPVELGYVEPVYFDPPIPLPDDYYPGVYTLYVQGIGFVHQPLSVGTHTIELVSGLSFPHPDYSYGVQFLNTWTITVEP